MTAELAVEAPSGAAQFDDEVDIVHKQTRSCLINISAEGMQAEETFLIYLQTLNQWITQRSEAEVKAEVNRLSSGLVF